ncbi:hypothetical protein ABIB25_001707 [Nakamurella sp. UYEF19]|uniref:DUF3592 domain-containing protein n=1 Tax=Nakamurella sp. UYEF19 TaxID=1756392 RepID=UPI00339AA289
MPADVSPLMGRAMRRRGVHLPLRRRRLGPGGGWLLASRIVLGVIGAVTLMVLALAVGMRLDDRQIDGHLGTATATVLSISALRTGIEFVDGGGVTIRPPNGVLYPGLLNMGQRFQVEYSTVDPTVVRVSGRTAAVGNLVLALTSVISWVIGFGVHWWLRRRAGRAARRREPEGPTRRAGAGPVVSRWRRRPSPPLRPAPPA